MKQTTVLGSRRVSTKSVKEEQILLDSLIICVCELCSHCEYDEFVHLDRLSVLQAYLMQKFEIVFSDEDAVDTEVDHGPAGAEFQTLESEDEAELPLADDCE